MQPGLRDRQIFLEKKSVANSCKKRQKKNGWVRDERKGRKSKKVKGHERGIKMREKSGEKESVGQRQRLRGANRHRNVDRSEIEPHQKRPKNGENDRKNTQDKKTYIKAES